jgi:RNA polymerase-associated protein LEO1
MSDSDEILDTVDDAGDDLFGDGDGDDDGDKLDELPESDISDDDNRDRRSPSEQRDAGGGYGSDDDLQHRRQVIASMTLVRHRTPKIKDGEVCSTIVLQFGAGRDANATARSNK